MLKPAKNQGLQTGRIVKYYPNAEGGGLGMIRAERLNDLIFFRRLDYQGRGEPKVGMTVEFSLGWEEEERYALAVRPLREEPLRRVLLKRFVRLSALPLGLALYGGLYLLVKAHYLPASFYNWYFGAGLLSLLLYGWDKWQAALNGPRISEDWLHLLDFCGGWPGALVGQFFFRHKLNSLRFQLNYWATVLANVALVAALLYSEPGRNLLRWLLQLGARF